MRAPRSLLKKPQNEDILWALKDVSFDIRHGDVLGIIGRNGAGKSTLLKILSRITEPTEGAVDLYGRVGSLLEVGTGFHPELTGRENIFLSGAIMGMRRAEIVRKFDEIVEFADVARFLDTPIKRYSSGMYMRLAFAVAAHLEPEILLVDEVLAVGDASFQKKCLGKLEDMGSSGRTVVFVSHSMPNITRLCDRVVLLDKGSVIDDGPPEKVTKRYLQSDHGSPVERVWTEIARAPGDAVARLHSVRVRNEAGALAESIDIREKVVIELEYWNLQSELRPVAGIWLTNEDGIVVLASFDYNDRDWYKTSRSPGLVTARCTLSGNFLAEGTFFILAAVSTYNPDTIHVIERDVVAFQITDRSTGDGVRGPYVGAWPGVVRPMLPWQIQTAPSQDVESYLTARPSGRKDSL